MSVFRFLGRRKRPLAACRNHLQPARLRIESLETRALVTSDLLTGVPLALYAADGDTDSTPAIVATDTVTGHAQSKYLEFTLKVTNDNGDPITGPLVVGQTFWLDVYINDKRQLNDAGAVTVQTDVGYSPDLVDPTLNFIAGPSYPKPDAGHVTNVNSNTMLVRGDVLTSGANPLGTPPGSGPLLLDRVQMTANSAGTVNFQTQFPTFDPNGTQSIFLGDNLEGGGGSHGVADPTAVAQGTTSATIVAAPNVSITGGAATTGAGATQITFTAAVTAAIGTPMTVHYQTVVTGTDNAVAGTDFTATNDSTVIIPANTLSQTFTIGIPDNTAFQGDKTFHVKLTSVDGGLGVITTGSDSDLGTIHYTKPTVSIADANLVVSTSAPTTMPFTVSLNHKAAVDVQVQYQTVSTGADNAVAGTDYVSALSTATILAGQDSAQFNVSINALSSGPNKTFHVQLLTAGNANISAANGSALATITNQIPGPPTVTVGAATSNTTETTLNFVVSRSGDLSQPITLNYQTSVHIGDSAVAGTDFTAVPNGSVTILAGQSSASIPIQIQHGQPGTTATFHIDLSVDPNSAPANLTTASVLGKIVNAPVVSLAGGNAGTVTATTGSSVPFTVSLPSAATSDVKVHYHTEIQSGDSADGNDFTPIANGVATIAAGSSSATFAISLPAAGYQGDRTFHVVIDSVEGNAAIINSSANSALGTIHYTKPTVSVADAQATQGSTPGVIQFVVTLSAAAQVPITVQYQSLIQQGDSANGASMLQPGVDFQTIDTTNGLTAPLVIAAGSTQGTIEIPIGVAQPGPGDKTFHLNIPSSDNASIADGLALGTIHDTLPALPKVTIGSALPQSSSGSNFINFPVHLDKVSSQPITIDFKTGLQGSDTAVSGTDFPLIKNGQITIPANTQDAVIKIDLPAGSAVATGVKTFHVTINVDPASTDAVTLGSTVSVSSQGPAVVITAATDTVTSSTQTNMNFQVNLQDLAGNGALVAAGQNVVVTYKVVSNSNDANPAVGGDSLSTPGVDFVTVANGQLTIAAGQKSGTITVPIAAQLAGHNKTLHVEITSATNAYLSATASATGTIANNIAKPVASIQSTATALEPTGSGTTNMSFTVTLGSKSSVDVTLNYQVTGVTAVAGTDFTPPNSQGTGTLTILAGQQTGTITVPILANPNVAPSAQLIVSITPANGDVTVNSQKGVGTGVIQTNGSFAGFAFIDTNNDGKNQTAEQKLPGVTITLDGTTTTGQTVHQTTVTGADGSYKFSNLAPGTYTATQSGLGGYTIGTAIAGAGVSGTGTQQLTFTITSGNELVNNAFGERGLQSQLITKVMFFSSKVH